MDTNTLNTKQEFKPFCAGKGCNKLAVRQMVIKFVHRTGWFCDSCAAELTELGLADVEDTKSIGFQGQ